MPPIQWIIILVIVVVGVVTAILQTLKNQREDEPEPPRRSATKPSTSTAAKSGNSDLDRFLQEIEKLKKKTAEEKPKGPPTLKPVKGNKSTAVPTISPKKPKPEVRREPVAEPLPVATTLPPMPPIPRGTGDATFGQSTAYLPSPVSTPVSSVPPPPPPPAQVAAMRITRPVTPFAVHLAGLMKNKQSVVTAVLMSEILGPPKCKRPGV